MGKSASGKDTLYKLLLNRMPELKKVVIHTTRPKREGEREGVEYFFDSREALNAFREQGKIVEERTYDTVMGRGPISRCWTGSLTAATGTF